MKEIKDYDSDKDSDLSFDSRKTLDWSNRNINSMAEYSLIREDEELFVESWHASALSNVSADYFALDWVELGLWREGKDSSPNL